MFPSLNWHVCINRVVECAVTYFKFKFVWSCCHFVLLPFALVLQVDDPTAVTELRPIPKTLLGYTHELQQGAYASFVRVGRLGSPATPSRQCSSVVTTPTVFVTRFEYHNLFHTSTDWYGP